MFKTRTMTLVLGMMLATGCSSSTAPVGLTGTWAGDIENNDGTHYSFSLQIVDSRGDLSGTARVELRDTAENVLVFQPCVMSGSANGNVTIQLACEADTSPWEFTAPLTANESTLSGTMNEPNGTNHPLTLHRVS